MVWATGEGKEVAVIFIISCVKQLKFSASTGYALQLKDNRGR
jgi:hypothetical protein